MYMYFLPLQKDTSNTESDPWLTSSSFAHALSSSPIIPNTAHIPSPDNGVEHTTASFLPASTWLSRAQSGEIILFPPQFYLLSLLAPYLSPSTDPITSPIKRSPSLEKKTPTSTTLQRQRDAIVALINSGDPPLGELCISPSSLGMLGGKAILGLEKPGWELDTRRHNQPFVTKTTEEKRSSAEWDTEHQNRRATRIGDHHHVVLVRSDPVTKAPQDLELRDRAEVLRLMRQQTGDDAAGADGKGKKGQAEKL
ncbi:MAG: Nucleoside diphosphate-linked moiety X motif 19, mitochondrial [Sclerophora amabilis]|nr:MAG: Nucleoside diphosphate-linked moiety X motif 19, mitochondrial [Sclerophora amabilis]